MNGLFRNLGTQEGTVLESPSSAFTVLIRGTGYGDCRAHSRLRKPKYWISQVDPESYVISNDSFYSII